MEIVLSVAFGLWYVISAIFYGVMTGKRRDK